MYDCLGPKSKVFLFLKAIDIKEWRDLGLLLENEDGLISDWAAVKRACGRFDKCRQWDNKPIMGTVTPIGQQTYNERQEPQMIRPRNDVAVGPTSGPTIEELAEMLR
mgnify:CR=1 FL=1